MTDINIAGRMKHYNNDQMNRVYATDGVSPTALVVSGGGREIKILDTGGNGMRVLKKNDFFCGGGGMAIGFKNAGFTIAGAWDFDKFAVQSYAHNISPLVKQADVSQMSGHGTVFKKKGQSDVPYADVWTFGFPCQDLSIAGEKEGIKVKCVDCETEYDSKEHDVCPNCSSEKRLSANRSGLFFEIMRLLRETEERNPSELPSIILAENVKRLQPYLGVLEAEYKKRGYKMYVKLYNSKWWGVPQSRERYFVVGVHESIEKEFVFPEQQELYAPKLSTVLETDVDDKFLVPEDRARNVIEEAKSKVELQGVHACLTPARPKRQNGPRAKSVEKEMFTLTAQDRHGVITEDFKVRKLTPREYARLQAFPESYEIVVSDSQAYKQFGNAVTTTVSQAIAERIRMFLLSL